MEIGKKIRFICIFAINTYMFRENISYAFKKILLVFLFYVHEHLTTFISDELLTGGRASDTILGSEFNIDILYLHLAHMNLNAVGILESCSFRS